MGKREYDDGRPKGLTTSYAFFIKKMSEQNTGEGKLPFSEFAKQCSQIWKNMSVEEKQPYTEMSATDKVRYDRELAIFKQNGGSLAKPGSKRAKQEAKDPNKPKTPRTAFFLFSAEMRDLVKQQNPDFKVTDVARELGRLWREIDEGTKAKFQEASEAERKIYHEKMAEYKAQKAQEAQEEAARQAQQMQYYQDNTHGEAEEESEEDGNAAGGGGGHHAPQQQQQAVHHQQYQQVQLQPQYVTQNQAHQATHYVKQYVQEVSHIPATTTYYQTTNSAAVAQSSAVQQQQVQQQQVQQQQQQQPTTSNGGYVYVSEGKQFYQQ